MHSHHTEVQPIRATTTAQTDSAILHHHRNRPRCMRGRLPAKEQPTSISGSIEFIDNTDQLFGDDIDIAHLAVRSR